MANPTPDQIRQIQNQTLYNQLSGDDRASRVRKGRFIQARGQGAYDALIQQTTGDAPTINVDRTYTPASAESQGRQDIRRLLGQGQGSDVGEQVQSEFTGNLDDFFKFADTVKEPDAGALSTNRREEITRRLQSGEQPATNPNFQRLIDDEFGGNLDKFFQFADGLSKATPGATVVDEGRTEPVETGAGQVIPVIPTDTVLEPEVEKSNPQLDAQAKQIEDMQRIIENLTQGQGDLSRGQSAGAASRTNLENLISDLGDRGRTGGETSAAQSKAINEIRENQTLQSESFSKYIDELKGQITDQPRFDQAGFFSSLGQRDQDLATRADDVRERQQALVQQLLGESEGARINALSNIRNFDVNDFQFQNSALESDLEASIRGAVSSTGPDAVAQRDFSDFQQRAGDARTDLISQLADLGILRAGGNTAEQLSRFTGEKLRGEQDILASAQQRRDALIGRGIDLRSVQNKADLGAANLNLDQRTLASNADIARLQAGEGVANATLNRLLTQTGVTEQERFAQDQANTFNQNAFQQAGLTGMLDNQQTLAGAAQQDSRDLATQAIADSVFGRQIGLRESDRADRAQLNQAAQFSAQLGQQGQQFQSSLGETREARAQQARQFGRQANQADVQISNQAQQFLAQLGFEQSQSNIQQQQFGRQANQQDIQTSNQMQQFLAELGFQEDQSAVQQLQFGRGANQADVQIANQNRQFLDQLAQQRDLSTVQQQQFGRQANQQDIAQNLQRDQFNVQQQQFGRQANQEDARLASQEQQFLDQLGLSRDQFTAQQLQFGRQANQADVQISNQNQQFLDQLGFQRDQSAQQARQFGRQAGQADVQISNQAQQFLDQLGFQRDQSAVQQAQFGRGANQADIQIANQNRQFLDQLAQQRDLSTVQQQQFGRQAGQQDRQMSIQDRQFMDQLAQQQALSTVQQQQFGRQAGQADRQISNQDRQFLESLAQQRDLSTVQQQQFGRQAGQADRQISNQEQQFLDSLGFQRDQSAQQARQFGRQAGQTDTQISNQAQQFLDSLGFQRDQSAQQARQFGRQANQQDAQLFEQQQARAQQAAQFGTSNIEQARQFFAQLNQQGSQFEEQQGLARNQDIRQQSQTDLDRLAQFLAVDQGNLGDRGQPIMDFLLNQINPDLAAQLRGLGSNNDDNTGLNIGGNNVNTEAGRNSMINSNTKATEWANDNGGISSTSLRDNKILVITKNGDQRSFAVNGNQ